MNNKRSISYFILIVTVLIFGCLGSVKERYHALPSSLSLHIGNEKYAIIDPKESVITWKGASLAGTNSHTGYIYISKGELRIEKGQLTGGTIEIDMNTIEDQKHERDNKLVNHLKDPDFFDVEKFPFSTIVITSIASIDGENKKVTGNLTIKGITHPVNFLAKTGINGRTVEANGKLVIDRSKWDVRYKSAKFYNLLANQTISDSIELEVKIVAKK